MSSRVVRVVIAALVVALAALVVIDRSRDDDEADPFACREEVLPRPRELRAPTAVPAVRVEAVLGDRSISAIAPLRDRLVYAGTREGEVVLVDVSGGPVTTVLDLRPLDTEREAGLQGLAVHPAGTHLYVTHTGPTGHENALVEYPIDLSGAVDAGSARVLLAMESPHQHHNMANLDFGPDGLLYVGVGDGGTADGDRRADPGDDAQDLASLRGKILRIDPAPSASAPYTVPDDNPFVDAEGARPEVFALGFRNPWRFSFDAGPGDLWIGDAGQFCAEEISHLDGRSAAGANLGWSGYEGFRAQRDDQQQEGTVPPVHAYPRGEDDDGTVRCAVIGGHVYRGVTIPALQGRYIFGDFCSSTLEVVDVVDRAVAVQVLAEVPGGALIQTIGRTAGGELLVGTDAGIFGLAPAG